MTVGWLAIIIAGIVSAFLAVLGWVLRRTDRALSRSNTAINTTNQNLAFTGQSMQLVEALRQAIYLQGNSLDQWEDWGVDVRRQNRALQRELLEHGVIAQVRDLPPPPTHLDLTSLFARLPHPNNVANESHSADKDQGGDDYLDKLLKSGRGD